MNVRRIQQERWRVFLLAMTAACVAFSIAAEAESGPSIHEQVAAAGPGDIVERPAGVFDLGRPLVITESVSLIGQGKEETILRSTAGEDGVMIRVDGADNVRLAGFTLDGAGNPALTQGVVISNGNGHEIEEIRIQDIPGQGGFGPHAIYASGDVTGSLFAHLEIRNIGPDSEWGAGIRIGQGGANNTIRDNRLEHLGRGGILTTHGSTDTRIFRNEVRDFGFAGPSLGIEVWGSGERVVIEHNTVDHWISVDGQTDVAVRFNTLTGPSGGADPGSYGLELVNSERVVMTDNIMEGGNHIGISVSNVARKDLVYYARNEMRNSETWGAQIQGEEGGAHRMYFHDNVFEGTRRSDASLYPGAAGHGFRFNGNAFQMTLDGNTFVDNAGAGVQLGGANLDRFVFTGNSIRDNDGAAITGAIDGGHLRWRGNDVADNAGGDDTPEEMGFDNGDPPAVAIVHELGGQAGDPVTFTLEGYDADQFSGVLWDLGAGIPQTGAEAEHAYDKPGTWRVAAIAWTTDGQGVLATANVEIAE